MLQSAGELGYRRQVMLLTGRMRVGLLGEGVDEQQVVCLDGEGVERSHGSSNVKQETMVVVNYADELLQSLHDGGCRKGTNRVVKKPFFSFRVFFGKKTCFFRVFFVFFGFFPCIRFFHF